MTAKEMEIRVLNDLSGLAAQRTRKFFREQIELELNAEVESFVVKTVVENAKGFFTINDSVADAIQPLLEVVSAPVHINENDLQVFVPLTSYKLLDVTGYGGFSTTAPTTSSISKFFYKIPIIKTTGAGPFYKIVKFFIENTEIYSRTGAIGYSTDDLFHAINELTDNVENLSWANAYHVRKTNELIFVSDAAGIPKVVLENIEYLGTLVEQKTASRKLVTTNNVVSTRRIKNQMRSEVLSTPYYKPTIVDLPIFLNKGVLSLHTPNNFIVNSVLLTYIRRPRKISLSLDIGCDLNPNYHAQICDSTVQRIRERIGDPKIQTGNAI